RWCWADPGARPPRPRAPPASCAADRFAPPARRPCPFLVPASSWGSCGLLVVLSAAEGRPSAAAGAAFVPAEIAVSERPAPRVGMRIADHQRSIPSQEGENDDPSLDARNGLDLHARRAERL